MAKDKHSGFVGRSDVKVERFPWGPHEWLCRADVVDTKELLMVRVNMPVRQGQDFHKQPGMEEIIYVLDGCAEVWVERTARRVEAGEIVHIPAGTPHAVFNGGRRVLRFLSVFGSARSKAIPYVDLSTVEPWASLRAAAADAAPKEKVAKKKKVTAARRKTIKASAQRTAARKPRRRRER